MAAADFALLSLLSLVGAAIMLGISALYPEVGSEKLNLFWDRIVKISSVHDAVLEAIRSIAKSIHKRRKSLVLKFLVFSFLANPTALFFATWLRTSWIGTDMTSVYYHESVWQGLGTYFTCALVGVVVDFVSLVITWQLLVSGVSSNSFRRLILHLTVDMLLVIAVVSFAVMVVPLVAWVLFPGFETFREASFGNKTHTGIYQDKRSLILPILIGLTAATPSLCYLFGALVGVMSKASEPVRDLFMRVILALATAKSIWTAFAAILGVMSGLAGALTAYLQTK